MIWITRLVMSSGESEKPEIAAKKNQNKVFWWWATSCLENFFYFRLFSFFARQAHQSLRRDLLRSSGSTSCCSAASSDSRSRSFHTPSSGTPFSPFSRVTNLTAPRRRCLLIWYERCSSLKEQLVRTPHSFRSIAKLVLGFIFVKHGAWRAASSQKPMCSIS